MEPKLPKFYTDVREAWEAMLKACSEAKETIDLEQYIFADDEISRRFVEVLRDRARNGVRIRVLCDGVGSWDLFTSRLPTLMRNDGIDIRFFRLIKPWRVHNALSYFFRDHRKILVVDGKIGFTGGTGIRDDMPEWRDTNVQVSNEIVNEMIFDFNTMWGHAEERHILSRIRKARQYAAGFQFVSSAPYFKKRFLYYQIIEALRNAKRFAYISTPYFIPDKRMTRVLKLAVKRGVDVRIIVPHIDIEPFVGTATRSHYEHMLKAGVKIFEYQPKFFHTKSIVIDDEWSTVGSFNLDSLSFIFNYEANIVSTDPVFAHELKNHFEKDLENSTEMMYHVWKNRPLIQKIKEFLIIPLRRFL